LIISIIVSRRRGIVKLFAKLCSANSPMTYSPTPPRVLHAIVVGAIVVGVKIVATQVIVVVGMVTRRGRQNHAARTKLWRV